MVKPDVSVILPTYNRPEYLTQAIASVVRQSLTNWELLVINDGGIDVGPIVGGFRDDRIRYHHQPENRGKSRCCNFGLNNAQGDFIAYLDDDDAWYPHHLEVLFRTLKQAEQFEAAYTDLYRVGFIPGDKEGDRIPIDKKLLVSRDFSRPALFRYNYVLHVSLMHTRTAGLLAGGYDESITAMIDWDIIRKLAMVTDLIHVPMVTGEYYAPLGITDRISHIQVKDPDKYQENLRRVKADIPSEGDLRQKSVVAIIPVSQPGNKPQRLIEQLLDSVSHPLRIILVNNGAGMDEGRFLEAMPAAARYPNISVLSLPTVQKFHDACRQAAEGAPADFYLLLSPDFDASGLAGRLEGVLEYLEHSTLDRAVNLDERRKPGKTYNLLVSGEPFLSAGKIKDLRIVKMRTVLEDTPPAVVHPDMLLVDIQRLMAERNFLKARRQMDRLRSMEQGRFGDPFLIDYLVEISLQSGEMDAAEVEVQALLERGYIPDNLLRLARIKQLREDYSEAAALYRKSLDALGIPPTVFDNPAVNLNAPVDCGLFQALAGLGMSLLRLGDLGQAERFLWMASRVNGNAPEPYMGYAEVLIRQGKPVEAEKVLARIRECGYDRDPGFLELERLLQGGA